MVVCKECSNNFEIEEAIKLKDRREFWGQPVFEIFYLCPYCKSDCYEKAGR